MEMFPERFIVTPGMGMSYSVELIQGMEEVVTDGVDDEDLAPMLVSADGLDEDFDADDDIGL